MPSLSEKQVLIATMFCVAILTTTTIRTFSFSEFNHAYTDLHEYLDACSEAGEVPRLVWTFWFGSDISENRTRALRTIESILEVPVVHLTRSNITEFTKWPVHPGIDFLSGVHKADYFRVYFMLHYGGGYTDIKHMVEPWGKYFEEFIDPDVWMVGVPEIKGGVARRPGTNYSADYYTHMISNGFMLARQNNPFLVEVHRLQNEDLDMRYETLIAHPSPTDGRCCQGMDAKGYPIRWAELCGELMAYAAQEYFSHFKRVMRMPSLKDYK